jgi:hypothetical protein
MRTSTPNKDLIEPKDPIIDIGKKIHNIIVVTQFPCFGS